MQLPNPRCTILSITSGYSSRPFSLTLPSTPWLIDPQESKLKNKKMQKSKKGPLQLIIHDPSIFMPK
jgi:hypothetical protein